MNDSGLAVRDALTLFAGQEFSGTLRDVLILVDDIHLAVGRTRVCRSGSEGGHNGLRSIVAVLETDTFSRIRLGVGKVPAGVPQIDYVLGQFKTLEQHRVQQLIRRGTEAVRYWCSDGVEITMNLFNVR